MKRRQEKNETETNKCTLTHTTTLGEEDNTKAVRVLIGKMAAKHLTRVLFLSALSSAISSSLSRSCSRQTFSSLVNTANSCGSHKAAFRGAQNKLPRCVVFTGSDASCASSASRATAGIETSTCERKQLISGQATSKVFHTPETTTMENVM